MRNFYFLFTLFMGASFLLTAQNTDFTRKHRYSHSKKITQRQNGGNQIELRGVKPFETVLADSSIYFYSGEPQYMEKYSEDNSGNIIIETYNRTGEINPVWNEIPSGKEVLKYNNEGRVVNQEYYSFEYDNNRWRLHDKETTTYYQGDKIKTTEYYYYDYDGTMIESSKSTINYGSNGLVSSVISKDYVEGVWVDEIVEIREAKKEGNKEVYIVYYKDSDGDEEISKTVYEYDSKGNEILWESWWDGTDEEDYRYRSSLADYNWTDCEKEVKTYDNKSRIISEESSYTSTISSSGSGSSYRTVYKYNEQGNRILEENYSKHSGTPEEKTSYKVYYYSGTSGIGSNKIENINISWNGNTLSITSPEAETVTIYSITGASLLSVKKAAGQIDISFSNLPKGIIIVKGQSGWTSKELNR